MFLHNNFIIITSRNDERCRKIVDAKSSEPTTLIDLFDYNDENNDDNDNKWIEWIKIITIKDDE